MSLKAKLRQEKEFFSRLSNRFATVKSANTLSNKSKTKSASITLFTYGAEREHEDNFPFVYYSYEVTDNYWYCFQKAAPEEVYYFFCEEHDVEENSLLHKRWLNYKGGKTRAYPLPANLVRIHNYYYKYTPGLEVKLNDAKISWRLYPVDNELLANIKLAHQLTVAITPTCQATLIGRVI